MSSIRVPIYSISGTGDKFIAPVKGCYKYLKAFKIKITYFVNLVALIITWKIIPIAELF